MKLNQALIFMLFAQLVCSQVQDKVDFISCDAILYPKIGEAKVQGQVAYKLQVLKNTDSIFLDAVNMDFDNVRMNGKSARFSNSKTKLVLKGPFKKSELLRLEFDYRATPKQTVYFMGVSDKIRGNEQIWTQGQGKYTSHWLPSLDDMNDKIEFDFTILADKEYEVVANGNLDKIEERDSVNAWHYSMNKPMSSYLAAFAIGNFDKESIRSSTGVPIELYYEPKDSLKVEPTFRYSGQIFDFLEKEIGVSYPWQNYKQVPVQDFLYAGMENTGATIFSNTFMVDSIAFVDKNFVNVNAHEMAHQWFGNLVTEQSGAHHWLHEGFATYYAYLAEKEIFGEDYFHWKLLETANALMNFSGEGNGEALTNASAGSLTFYEKGAWALVMLRDRVGDEAFKEGIRNYLNQFAYQNVTITDFMWEMEKASGMKLSDFEEQWLQESEFPFEIVKTYLVKKSPSIKKYFSIKGLIGEQANKPESVLMAKWDSLHGEPLKQQLVLEYGNTLPEDFLGKLLQEEGLKVRQAVALSLEELPAGIHVEFESLLEDRSYKTIESALFRLWTDFPGNRKKYLDQTKYVDGFPNKNVRLLWLTLALVTPDYENELKRGYFKELNDYTGAEHHFEVRMLAFQFLKSIGGFNDDTLKNLIQACSHHVWHFKKSSRKMLKDFLKAEGNYARVKAIYPTLNLEQQQYLDKTLGK